MLQVVAKKYLRLRSYKKIFKKFHHFTMIPERYYISNLMVAEKAASILGDVVECGVWRGGMIAGIASILGQKRHYYLYDSFEGLPPAKEIDGVAALQWQENTHSANYYDNCKAEISYAQQAMALTNTQFKCVKGWFNETVPHHPHQPIALLRLDGDWYESTMVCLQNLYPKVVTGGIIIIDDYYSWDGCSKAVHDYLSSIQSASRVRTGFNRIAYILKND